MARELNRGLSILKSEHQFQALGVPYEGRTLRMRKTIAAIRELWRRPGEAIDYQGTHIQLKDVALAPAPHRAGGPPVWLAGIGERAERHIGEIADGWLPYPPAPKLYAKGWQRAVEAAVQAGPERPPHPALYATICLDHNSEYAKELLRERIERYYGQPVELIATIQAMFAGTPDGLADWLSGSRHNGPNGTASKRRRLTRTRVSRIFTAYATKSAASQRSLIAEKSRPGDFAPSRASALCPSERTHSHVSRAAVR